MGCDIHLHIELKLKGQRGWSHYNNPSVMRNYDLFALMANVRNSDRAIEPISEPKGLPGDLSFITQLDYKHWEGDAHSESWLTSKEVALIDEWNLQEDVKRQFPFGYLFGGGYADFHKYRDDYYDEIKDFRFVFWFDN